MRWSKIKNIILLLLVIVNLALAGLVGGRTWRSAQNERLARERMVQILSNNNIDFLPGEVPGDLDLPALRLTPGEEPGPSPLAEDISLWLIRDGRAGQVSAADLAGAWETLPSAQETVTGSTALLRFLETLNRDGYVCTQVTAMYPGYLVSGSAALTLTPVWFIETDTRPWRFAVDGFTGTVTSLE